MKAGILTVPLHHGREIMKDLKSQKGEIVMAVMVVMMVGMMIFGGMYLMHGGRDDKKQQEMTSQQSRSGPGNEHRDDRQGDGTKQPAPENGSK